MGRGGQRWPRLLAFSAKGRWVVWREIARKSRGGSQAAELSHLGNRPPFAQLVLTCLNTTTASPKGPLREGVTALEQSRCFSSLGRQRLGCEEMALCD